jgi:hypothetical protein
MRYAVPLVICAILLPTEWFLFKGTLKLLSGPLGFYRGTPQGIAASARKRKHLSAVAIGLLWAATIAVFIWIGVSS